MRHRYKVPIAVFFALLKDNPQKIFLLKRAQHLSYPGLYGLPGGGVEENESIKQALSREAMEEIGITFPHNPLRIIPLYHQDKPSDFFQIEYYFFFDAWEGEIINKEPDKHPIHGFYDLSAPPDPMFTILKHVLTLFKEGKAEGTDFVLD